MTIARRRGLVALARAHDALVICDDIYDFLQWPALAAPPPISSLVPLSPPDPLPRLVDIDLSFGPSQHDSPLHFGHAISNGTFSKIIAPGMRTGWVEGTRAFAFGLAQTGSTKSGGAPSQIAAAMVCEMMRSGDMDQHLLTSVRPALQRRHALMVQAVREHLAGFVDMEPSRVEEGRSTYGGYFVWLTLSNDLTQKKLRDGQWRTRTWSLRRAVCFEFQGMRRP